MSAINLTIDVVLIGLLLCSLLYVRKFYHQLSELRVRLDAAEASLDDLSHKNTRLHREVNTDGLTKVGNRAHFEISYKMEWDRSVRHKGSLALLMIDIDHFKRINDEYGHVTGDECIVAVALAIRGCLHRSSDRVMRYGGEEFVVLLGDTDEQGIVRLGERILDAVRGIVFPQGFTLTVSIGASSLIPMKQQKSSSFVDFADQALYQAKNTGRDRLVFVPSESEPVPVYKQSQG